MLILLYLNLDYFVHHNQPIIKSDNEGKLNYINLYSKNLIELLGEERKINEDLTIAKELQTEAEKIQDHIEKQLKQARDDASEMIKSSSVSFQNKTNLELTKLDKELDSKIDQSAKAIEKSKNESVSQIQAQINEITRLTLSKVASFNVSDEEIKSAVKSAERSLN